MTSRLKNKAILYDAFIRDDKGVFPLDFKRRYHFDDLTAWMQDYAASIRMNYDAFRTAFCDLAQEKNDLLLITDQTIIVHVNPNMAQILHEEADR